MLVSNKTIVVTGAGNGIGRELTLKLLEKGANVLAVDISETNLNQTAELSDNNEKLKLYIVNITDKKAVDEFASKAIETHRSIHGLINNAGIIQPFVRINDLTFEAIERVMNVNFYGLLYMTKAFLPHILLQSEGHIVNISSMGGFLPVPGQSVYGASKAAVKLLTEALYAELLNTKVGVSIVFPGAIATNIATNSQVSVPNMPENGSNKKVYKTTLPTEAAEIIIKGIESNKERIFIGSDSKLMNFLYSLNPGFATRLIGKQMKSLLP